MPLTVSPIRESLLIFFNFDFCLFRSVVLELLRLTSTAWPVLESVSFSQCYLNTIISLAAQNIYVRQDAVRIPLFEIDNFPCMQNVTEIGAGPRQLLHCFLVECC